MESFLTVDELAGTLKVSRVLVYKMVRQKRIPFYHIEKCVRFLPSEIQEWLETKKMIECHRPKVNKVDKRELG